MNDQTVNQQTVNQAAMNEQPMNTDQPASKPARTEPDGDMGMPSKESMDTTKHTLDWDAMDAVSYPSGYTKNDKRGYRSVLTWLEKNRDKEPPQAIRNSKHFEHAKAQCEQKRNELHVQSRRLFDLPPEDGNSVGLHLLTILLFLIQCLLATSLQAIGENATAFPTASQAGENQWLNPLVNMVTHPSGWGWIPATTSGADRNESGGRAELPGQPLMNVSGVRQVANPAGLQQIRRRGDDTRHQDEEDQVNHRQNARDPHRGCVIKHAVRAASASAAIDIGGLTCGSPDLRCRTARPADAIGASSNLSLGGMDEARTAVDIRRIVRTQVTTNTMSEKTMIHWCDSTCNPVMGCDGCPLFPTMKCLVTAVSQALGAAGFDVAKTSEMASTALGGMAPSEAYHRRRDIAEQVAGKLHKMNDRKLRNGIEKAIASKFSCYASSLHLRFGKDPTQPDKKTNKGYAPTFEQVTCFPGRMAETACMKDLTGKARADKPWLDGLPHLTFVSDMGDALSSVVPFEYLQEEIVQVAASPKGSHHIWLWLTKRPARMAEFAGWLGKQGIAWPRNLVPMASAIDRRMTKGISHLRKIPGAACGLSVEPLLESVKLDLNGIDWVIVGGESGSYARPFELAWARDIARQCREAGCAFFMKQLGAKPLENGRPLKLVDTHGADWLEWPEDLRVREMPEAFRSLTTATECKNQAT